MLTLCFGWLCRNLAGCAVITLAVPSLRWLCRHYAGCAVVWLATLNWFGCNFLKKKRAFSFLHQHSLRLYIISIR
jgi:hypothetical protein